MVVGAACRAWCGMVKDALVRDGATTVQAVPMTLMHNDGSVATIQPLISLQHVLHMAWTH